MLEVPETPQTPLPEIESFTLWCNDTPYVFEGDIFIKMSKKAAQIAIDGKVEAVVGRKVKEDTMKSFYQACSLKPFTVTAKNAYELKKLAEDFEVPTLEKYVNNYIKEKNIAAPPEIDYLGILKQHCDSDIEDPTDILNVSEYINDALRDERLPQLPPEIIFKVINAADPQKIDNQLLINFTLRLLEVNPSSAVPILMLLDFDRLSKDQRELIFHTSDIHDQNVNYFVATAFSSARNKNALELEQAEAQLNEDLDKMREALTKLQAKTAEKMKHDQDEALDQMDAEVAEMGAKIQELKSGADAQRQKIEKAAADHENAFAEMKARLEQIDKLTSQRNSKAAGQNDKIKTEVTQQMDELRAEMDVKVKNLANDDAKRCQSVQRDLKRAIDAEQQRLKQLRSKAEAIVDTLNATNEDLGDFKATLASKIVRDRLRFDKFIRKVDNRLDLFKEEPGVWGLGADSVAQAEKFINDIEEKVDECCPIRGKKNE
ncbi:hypothetical protein TRFO_34207 [Tritrichomonas foetus]|uniref:Uncharacterized protein n=1 Tax=Tritrichomonas foetus TaxID=1144522 RepID=A0A1J4JL10_9EUKA|nr:hypothetical protein TRFO_34207 [Tritrichomonas foetus]|eukprot:OHS99353.1 hypothetical protein TRFO_34207 [Tritrichomonas foetus]